MRRTVSLFAAALLLWPTSGFTPVRVASRRPIKCSAAATPGPVVAVTREKHKSTLMIDNLSRMGVSCVCTPSIQHSKGEDWEELPRLLQDMRWAYVCITSPESAVVLHGAWEAAGHPCLHIASIGESTTKKLRSKGLEPAFQCSQATAEALGAELPAAGVDNRILYPASAIAPDTLETFLRSRRFDVVRKNVYTTEPAVWSDEELEMANQAEIVAFASPSAVESWKARVGTDQMAVCIGPTTAAACIVEGWANDKVIFPLEDHGYKAWLELIKTTHEKMASTSAA